MRALIYARVSLDSTGQGRSVTEQEIECREWAAREGWTVTTVITETGSASRYARSTAARQRWPEVTDAIAAGQHDILLAWEASRTTRDLAAYTELRDLCARHNVRLGYSGTLYDLTNRSDRFRTGLDALLSEDEAGRTSERVSRAARARAAAGTPHGKLLYGYRREYDPHTGALLRQIPNEATAPIVAEITRRVGAQESLYAIARDLTERGIPLPRPARTRHNADAWVATTIRRIAINPAYAGHRIHRGEIIGPATWPAIVTDEQQASARASLDRRPAANPTGDATARWLLSGIARCGRPTCRGPLRIMLNRGNRTYTCGWCFQVARKHQPVDDLVLARLRALLTLTPPPSDTPASHPDIHQAEQELRTLQDRREDFLAHGIAGTMSADLVAKADAALAPQIARQQRLLASLRAPARLARWDLTDDHLIDNLDIAGRRALIRDAITVTVLPAGRGHRTFDPDLIIVTPTWGAPDAG